jgi:hypothetical protein
MMATEILWQFIKNARHRGLHKTQLFSLTYLLICYFYELFTKNYVNLTYHVTVFHHIGLYSITEMCLVCTNDVSWPQT